MTPFNEKIVLTNYVMKQEFQRKETNVFSIRLNVEILEVVEAITSEMNISKNQLISVALYKFLKDEDLLKK